MIGEPLYPHREGNDNGRSLRGISLKDLSLFDRLAMETGRALAAPLVS